ncbi:MAG: demethoxyubiquinone hydroxylase family protein [Azospirillum brasilense]|nr:MAG: demethoxyubiquinone hydroxylase family protein [Azospirillum brasilense]
MTHPTNHRRHLPGDAAVSRPSLAQMLRVNHAGEYGAKRIYAGQLAVLGRSPIGPELRHMAAQEQVHLDAFNRVLPQQRVRPTALMPLWHVGGFMLGAGSALLGPKAAMACTVAVESVITEHYDSQLDSPEIAAAGLRDTIQQFRDEEMEHHDTGLAHDAEQAPAYGLLSAAIRGICKTAIYLSARV